MEGDDDSVLDATDAACADALAALDGEHPLGCSPSTASPGAACSATTASRDEVERIGDACGGAPVAGFYTYGEIARTRGISGFHNQTLVVLAVG